MREGHVSGLSLDTRSFAQFVPLTDEAGLSEVQCTWGGVFVAEAISALRPAWHLLLSDTDVAPTALFEIHELPDLCKHITHEALVGGEPGLLGT